MTHAVTCIGVSKTYRDNALPVHALRNVDFAMQAGEFVSLAGPSGSGKSTLLNMIGGLDRPDSGTVRVGDAELTALGSAALAEVRLRQLGFIFQAYNLIPVLSAVENVEFTMQLQRVPKAERRERALRVLEDLGLAELAQRRPAEMSGGQQQRVAIARAIVTDPVLLLADEPSANLDSKTTESLLELLAELNAKRGLTILTATHDPLVMRHARRHVQLKDGEIVSDDQA